jgi:hypothetical protein
MGHPSAGDQCKNKQYTDDWEVVNLLPRDEETAEVQEDLQAQDNHLDAEMMERGDFFAIEATDDDEHAFYILQAKGSIQLADDTLEDVYGNVMLSGTYFVEGHFLEWKNKGKQIYRVDTQKIAYISSHLVAVSKLEMERVADRCWKLSPGEEERIDILPLS